MRSRAVPQVVVALLTVLLVAGCSAGEGADDAAEQDSTSTAAPAPSAVDTLMDRGLQQVQQERYAAARGTFDSILAIDPDNAFATYNLGFIAQRQGQDPRAIELYAEATRLDPEFAAPLYNLAILTEGSDLDAAAAFYRRVLDLQPEDAPTLMRLGYLLQHQGEQAEGRRLLDRAIELDPTLRDVQPPVYPSGS